MAVVKAEYLQVQALNRTMRADLSEEMKLQLHSEECQEIYHDDV